MNCSRMQLGLVPGFSRVRRDASKEKGKETKEEARSVAICSLSSWEAGKIATCFQNTRVLPSVYSLALDDSIQTTPRTIDSHRLDEEDTSRRDWNN